MIYARYLVDNPTGEAPGTIVIDTKTRLLHLVLPNGKAMRYGVAVGDEAYGWEGTARVARKAEWPDWNPPAEMKQRWPHVHYMKGGPANPLGARAMYIYQDGRDTLYRLHGTMEVWSIGGAVSSGCVRLLFHDIIDLYGRCPVGTPIVVNA